MPKKVAQTAEQSAIQIEAVPAQPTRLELLESFKDLVAERWGYLVARKSKQSEANKAVKADATKARDITKESKEALDALVKTPSEATSTTYTEKLSALKTARKVVADGRKPYNEAIKPLSSAIRYVDNVAIPDSLKELGSPVTPRFSLSSWCAKAVEASKKKD